MITLVLKIIMIAVLAIITELIKAKPKMRLIKSLWLTLLELTIIGVGIFVASKILINPSLTLNTASRICDIMIVINVIIICVGFFMNEKKL